MAPIRHRKKDAADQTLTCLDALRLLDISRDAPPTLNGTGPAGEATTPPPPPPPPLPQEVVVEAEPGTSKLPSPPQEMEVEPEPDTSKHSSPPQKVEAEPDTSKHSSPPPALQEAEAEAKAFYFQAEAEAESDMSKHIKAVWKAILGLAALPDYDERYGSYGGVFFKAYIQAPRPIDPLWLPEPDAAGLRPIAGRYPYLAGELARIADGDTAEQRETLSGGLLQQVDAATLAALEGEFHEATWAGKKTMLAKLEAEVQYAKARIDAEAMIEMLGAGKAPSSSV